LDNSTLLEDLSELVQVYRGGKLPTKTPRAAAAVVLGAQVCPGGRPSRTLRVRALFAAQLYSEKVVKVVIPTGGVGDHPPSEAAVVSEVLRNAGVPDKHILPEEQGRSTQHSVQLVAQLARSTSIDNVLVVTDPLHCIRACWMFRKAGLCAVAAPVYDSPMWSSLFLRRQQFFREMGAIVWYRAKLCSRW
jgi:vancomycin permeability regulator SanA